MAAVYCGTKRSYLEDLPSPHSSKRLRFRCYSPSNSPIWSSPPSALDQLRTAFPHPVLAKALEEHGSDLDAAMKSLYSLEEKKYVELAAEGATEETDAVAAGKTYTATGNSPISGDDWVELMVREVTQSTGTDDAKVRAGRVLEALEKMLSAEAGKKFQDENVAVQQQQVEALIKDNTVLKRAVAIQHERQKSFDDVNQQLQLLKHLIPQYQKKLRTLEVNNYALRMHLQQVEHGSSMPGRFNPHVF